MAQIIQLRGDSAANWTSSNPTLADREMAIEIGSTNKIKIGDGATEWNDLPYLTVGGGGWRGEWDWSDHANADPDWSPGEYGEGVGERGTPGDANYVPDKALIMRMTTGFKYL